MTVTASGADDRFETSVDVSTPGCALCSISAGIIDSPPIAWAAAPPAAAFSPSAVPPTPSVTRTAPSAMYRFM